jgi:hypothetical protein
MPLLCLLLWQEADQTGYVSEASVSWFRAARFPSLMLAYLCLTPLPALQCDHLADVDRESPGNLEARRDILHTDRGSAGIALAAARSLGPSVLGLPPFLLRSRAAWRPALVRSRMTARSNSAAHRRYETPAARQASAMRRWR